jgi:methionine-rich copper-binding protein CopC
MKLAGGQKRRFVLLMLILVLCGALALSSRAWAHAVLVRSQPAANTTIHAESTDISLEYNSRIDAARSTLTLVDPHGHEQRLTFEKSSSDSELRAHVDHLTQGNYTLRWQVLATDGHITRGVVSFAVQ